MAKQNTEVVIPTAELIANAMAEMRQQTDGSWDVEQMLTSIFEADTLDDVLENAPVHLKDVVGETLVITGAKLLDSDYQGEGLPVYAVMDTETHGVVVTGATQPVAVLVKCHSAGWFPITVTTEVKTTKQGFEVLKFIKP